MRTAGSFLAILGGGVLIVTIYLWSGESVFVLIMSILTLFAIVALYEWRPWAPDHASPLFARTGAPSAAQRGIKQNPKRGRPDQDAAGSSWTDGEAQPPRGEPTGQHTDLTEINSSPADQGETVWRSRFDIIWDEDDLAGLSLGDTEPTSFAWASIEDVGLGLCQAIAQGDLVEERLGLVVQFTHDAPDADPTETQLMFGAEQDPEVVAWQAAAAFRASWVTNSPLHALTAAGKTRKLVEALSPTPISLSRETRSPELLYQELRRTLLTNRAIRRLSSESQSTDVIAAVEALFGTHQLARLTPAETAELSQLPDDGITAVLDYLSRQRGRALAFIGSDESDDYLLGLLESAVARHWDGQPVGSGLITVRLLPLS